MGKTLLADTTRSNICETLILKGKTLLQLRKKRHIKQFSQTWSKFQWKPGIKTEREKCRSQGSCIMKRKKTHTDNKDQMSTSEKREGFWMSSASCMTHLEAVSHSSDVMLVSSEESHTVPFKKIILASSKNCWGRIASRQNAALPLSLSLMSQTRMNVHLYSLLFCAGRRH